MPAAPPTSPTAAQYCLETPGILVYPPGATSPSKMITSPSFDSLGGVTIDAHGDLYAFGWNANTFACDVFKLAGASGTPKAMHLKGLDSGNGGNGLTFDGSGDLFVAANSERLELHSGIQAPRAHGVSRDRQHAVHRRARDARRRHRRQPLHVDGVLLRSVHVGLRIQAEGQEAVRIDRIVVGRRHPRRRNRTESSPEREPPMNARLRYAASATLIATLAACSGASQSGAGAVPSAPSLSYPAKAHTSHYVYVSSQYNSQGAVFVYSTKGQAQLPVATITAGINVPAGLAVDATGNLYVANSGNSTVTVYPPARRRPAPPTATGSASRSASPSAATAPSTSPTNRAAAPATPVASPSIPRARRTPA